MRVLSDRDCLLSRRFSIIAALAQNQTDWHLGKRQARAELIYEKSLIAGIETPYIVDEADYSRWGAGDL